MTYFQEKLQQLLVTMARKFDSRNERKIRKLSFGSFVEERDNYRTMYLREHDRRLQAELRLKENNSTPLV